MDPMMPWCLCAMLLLSLVLPLLVSVTCSSQEGQKSPSAPVMAQLWTGQICMGVIALLMIVQSCPPVLAVALSAMVCLVFARVLRRSLNRSLEAVRNAS